jgi:hypothetical protein
LANFRKVGLGLRDRDELGFEPCTKHPQYAAIKSPDSPKSSCTNYYKMQFQIWSDLDLETVWLIARLIKFNAKLHKGSTVFLRIRGH